MKKNLSIILLLAGSLAMAFAGCNKDITWKAAPESTEGMAYVRFFHASPNFRPIMGNRDSFNVYYAGTKINGLFLTYNSSFPTNAGTLDPSYLAVPAGFQLLKYTVNGVTTPDSIQLHSFDKTLQAGKYYSVIITDSVKSTDPAKQMFLEDVFNKPVPGEYSIRFVNTVWSETTNVDLFSTKQNMNLFTNVAKGGVTGFINRPLNPSGSTDTLIVRRTGTTTEIARLNTIVLSSTRVYTAVYRGSATGTGTKVRGLSVYRNY